MTNLTHTTIIIEDDPAIRRFLRTGLRTQNFNIYEASTGKQGIIETEVRKPDLVILDLGLPDMNGIEVIKAIRTWSTVPIIILSARSGEQDKIDALDAGADDYLTKPFGFGELLARIRVALRHSMPSGITDGKEVFISGDLKVDFHNRLVSLGENPVHLTPIQYRLLSALIKHAGKVLTHQQILKEVWGPSYQENAHYLRIYMSQLRQKIETDPTQPKHLLTESGVGYRFKAL
jgi:two-component system, OmpR family, KDP operon response regulator KdpE